MTYLKIRELSIIALLATMANTSYGQICTVSIGDLSSLCNGSTASIGPVQEPGYAGRSTVRTAFSISFALQALVSPESNRSY